MQNNLIAAAEAVLFAYGEPLELNKLAEALSLDISQAKNVLKDLSEDLNINNRGIQLLKLGDFYQLATREEHIEKIRSLLDKRRNSPLSQAAFEVLAILAYNQPVTKAFIEQVRGVDCSGVISTLLQKNLIEEAGRLDLPGRPLVYCTTTNFLRCFNLSDISELPKLPDDVTDEQEESNNDIDMANNSEK